MDRIVSNATPLIYLAKADRLHLLRSIVKETLIPESVHKEVVVRGKQREEPDAYRVEAAIKDGWMCVKQVTVHEPVRLPLHAGEMDVISLAKEKGISAVLMDEAKARVAAELAGLEPRGTLWVFLESVRNGMIDFDRFLAALENLTACGFYLSEDVYLKTIRSARDIAARISGSRRPAR